ncbi:integumentary mucin A.1-like [Papaver somniferum]|uniref:integumentary mucin A.1-like n=1 Tax=Papaver somniferum TaxID=3469 RepID=UPI000E702E25|nr:integumentary mucin A.1-like [Papaver somniferum]
MVELRSGSAASSENTNAESVPGVNAHSSGITTPPTGPSSTESTPSGVTPPVTRARAAATTPNTSSSMAPPTATRIPVTPPTERETRGARGSRPYITITDLMERHEVLARSQTDMVPTQKEVLVFLKALKERLPQESRHPKPMETPPTPLAPAPQQSASPRTKRFVPEPQWRKISHPILSHERIWSNFFGIESKVMK